MARIVALLRGVNLAGHKSVAMADLCGVFTKLGFADVRSLLQSGNLVCEEKSGSGAALERTLEAEIKKRLALETDVFVRTAAEWNSIIAANPFRDEATRDPAHLVVVCLKDAPAAKSVEALRAAITGPEVVHVKGRQAYIVYPSGIGTSRLTAAVIDKKLATRGTARNWNTVLKIAALLER